MTVIVIPPDVCITFGGGMIVDDFDFLLDDANDELDELVITLRFFFFLVVAAEDGGGNFLLAALNTFVMLRNVSMYSTASIHTSNSLYSNLRCCDGQCNQFRAKW